MIFLILTFIFSVKPALTWSGPIATNFPIQDANTLILHYSCDGITLKNNIVLVLSLFYIIEPLVNLCPMSHLSRCQMSPCIPTHIVLKCASVCIQCHPVYLFIAYQTTQFYIISIRPDAQRHPVYAFVCNL